MFVGVWIFFVLKKKIYSYRSNIIVSPKIVCKLIFCLFSINKRIVRCHLFTHLQTRILCIEINQFLKYVKSIETGQTSSL